MADSVIVLADSTIKEQGAWDSLSSKSASIAKMIHPKLGASGGEDTEDLKLSVANRPKGQTVKEASEDLNRKNGDLSLYGKATLSL